MNERGCSPNIISECAKVHMELRSRSRANLHGLDEMVLKCVKAAAMALDCQVEIDPIPGIFDNMVHLTMLEQAVGEIFDELGLPYEEIKAPNVSSKVDKWWKFITPVFLALVGVQAIMMILATVIGFGM